VRIWLAVGVLVWAWQVAAFEPHRFALVVGAPEGGPGTQKLRYAERDAKRIHSILTRLGGVRPEDARLLLSAGSAEMRRSLDELSERSRAARSRGEETLLLVYFSGHAKDGELRLGESRFPLEALRASLQGAPADVRIGFVDSCQSGAIARAKGVRKAPAFDVSKASSPGPQGLVLIASSAADEDSQESDAIGASFFTHYLASGLLGDADASGDGKVTLAEAYAYAYGRTVGSTVGTAAGVQHPVYLYDLGGAGDVVLTELAPATGGLVFPAELEGLYVVLDGSHRAVAEVAKPRGSARRLALPAGSYTVKKRLPSEAGLLVGDFEVGRSSVEVDEARMERLALEKDPQKGFGGARWSMLAGVGGQYFFDGAARSGLFPPAALGGVELTVRDDLGHGLAWGLDLALGGGSSALALDSSSSLEVRFGEVSGGASLWKDFEADPFTFSVGLRVAAIYIWRSFPSQQTQLPSQYFFTVTPGIVGAVSWHLSDSLSVVARLRLNYLFYNVDSSMNLGYTEGVMGVEYAF
jgi:hypothetical protein